MSRAARRPLSGPLPSYNDFGIIAVLGRAERDRPAQQGGEGSVGPFGLRLRQRPRISAVKVGCRFAYGAASAEGAVLERRTRGRAARSRPLRVIGLPRA